ncbi:MAG: tetratricopeptide repeat protein [Gammaproteobacteria bacterium]|nr:tetratricopeptide repeat protein [Gammaproteobacteria bacterium]
MSLLFDNWPELTRPYWLLLLPVLTLLLWSLYRSQQQQYDWRSVLPPAFHSILLNQDAPRQRKINYVLLGAAWLCALLALLGPSWEKNTAQEQAPQQPDFPPLVIAIQLTPELLATDLAPSRLEHIRDKVLNLLELRDTALTALVVYAGSAHTLVPLSNDLLTSHNLLQALQPDLMPVAGQRADLAIERAIQLLEQGAQGEGQVVLISTGITVNEQHAIEKLLRHRPIHLKVLGAGSTEGAPIVLPESGHFVTDAKGAIIISRLDETSLQLLAKQTGGSYMRLSTTHLDLLELDLLRQSSSHRAHMAQQTTDKSDQGYWLIFPLMLIVLSCTRRGNLLLLLICLLPLPSFAFNLEDLWLRPDQRGAKLIEQQPALAAQYFTDPLWRASALYLAEDYQGAADLFAQYDTPQAHYNRGNALALAGLFLEAMEAYQQALKLDPDLLAAQYNLATVEDHLKTADDNDTKEQTAKATQTTPSNPTDSASPTATAPISKAASIAPQQSDTSSQAPQADTQLTQPTSASIAEQTTPPTDSPAQQHQPLSDPHPVQLESWLEQIPDDPSELLKRKFWFEHTMQETAP